MELVKLKPKCKKDYYSFQQHYFNLGAKVHSQRNAEKLSLIQWYISKLFPEYKNTSLAKAPYGIVLFKDEKGFYFQNVDSLNFNLSKAREIFIEEIKNSNQKL